VASTPRSRDLYLGKGYSLDAAAPLYLPDDGPPVWPMWRAASLVDVSAGFVVMTCRAQTAVCARLPLWLPASSMSGWVGSRVREGSAEPARVDLQMPGSGSIVPSVRKKVVSP